MTSDLLLRAWPLAGGGVARGDSCEHRGRAGRFHRQGDGDRDGEGGHPLQAGGHQVGYIPSSRPLDIVLLREGAAGHGHIHGTAPDMR